METKHEFSHSGVIVFTALENEALGKKLISIGLWLPPNLLGSAAFLHPTRRRLRMRISLFRELLNGGSIHHLLSLEITRIQ